ncbi:RDD family protein [Endozoicomonas sp. SM1973]|uniref:RDD family protein n=1 Tax=Spartinivicinus marinus TaxID=2994442 RepID=A0A853ICK1_9GAMM|nr:RDD family protein [Spartinivicinus marinus]MCX4026427.1 RDD family protein [Spartinivicinus marinus]NYZ69582.1 RDD family protein [Spartinivicinus marinus]
MQSSKEIYQAPEAKLDKPEEVKVYELASRWRRLVAYFLDLFICGLIEIVLLVFLDFFVLNHAFEQLQEENPAKSELILVLIFIPLFFIINGKMLARSGQTFGKKLLGIAIVSYTTNKTIPVMNIILFRYGIFWALSFIPLAGETANFFNIVAIFGKEKRCLHDLVADTKVVRVR